MKRLQLGMTMAGPGLGLIEAGSLEGGRVPKDGSGEGRPEIIGAQWSSLVLPRSPFLPPLSQPLAAMHNNPPPERPRVPPSPHSRRPR